MKQTGWKRLCAAMMTLVMLLSVVPGSAFAVDASATAEEERAAKTYSIQVSTEEGFAEANIQRPDGTKESVKAAAPGEKICLDFTDVDMTPGTAFVKWVDDNGNLKDLQNADRYHSCTFTMPEGEVRVHAELAKNSPTITVENGGLWMPEGDQLYWVIHTSVSANRTVNLRYDDELSPAGKDFAEWYVKSGDVVLSDPTSKDNCSFVVPNGNVEIGVKYTEGVSKIRITTDEGYGYAVIRNPDGSNTNVQTAKPGQKIYLQFSDSGMTPGTAFLKWVDDNGNLTDLQNDSSYRDCSFTMPTGEVRIHAEYATNCPKITVDNGAVSVPIGPDFIQLNHPYVVPGREVKLYYSDAQTPAGKIFKEWYVKSGDVVLSDPSGRDTCSFIVPDHNVEIGVRYEDARSISVENGYAQYYLPNGDYVWNTHTAAPGTQMYLMVNPYTRPEGMAFSKWVVKKGNVQLDSPYSSNSCPFIMPDENVEIAAEFVPGYALTVEGGETCKTIPGNEFDWYIDMAVPGDQVWAVYDAEDYPAPEGMEFARWVVTQGSMQLDHPEDKTCSFTMPSEAVVVSAAYKPVGGKAESGWGHDQAGWWYNDKTGHYVTGWQDIGSKRYYFHENGYMAKDEWIDGQYVDESGALVGQEVATGWQNNDYGWWYNDENGNYVTGWKQINGYWYYFASNGYMQTGWQVVNGYWYHFSPKGDAQTGWQQINGYWYYFAPGGDMQTGWQVINGYWYYFSPSGDMQTGWQVVNGYWYYFAPSGYMLTGWQVVNGYWYYFAPSGYMLTGWQVINGYWYYFSPSGDMQTGWQWINGYCYYFYPSGYMATNTWIGGSYVNGSGAWVQ